MRKLPLILHLRTVDGQLAAALDSPGQGQLAMPASMVIRDESLIRLVIPSTMAFEGHVAPDGQAIEGRWRLGRVIVPIRLTRGIEPPRRPQTPVAPYPYREEEVAYRNPAANVRLAGTLTLPAGQGPFPAVLLVGGSGAQNRDEQGVDGHRPFAVLADHLTRQGIAVLRVDKRGVGFSTGDYDAATLTDFTADVEAGLAYLRGRPDIAASRVGLLGHSEGGLIAPLAASRDPNVAFVVMLAGPGVPFADVLPLQSARTSLAAGVPPGAIEKRMESDREILKAVLAAPSETDAFNAARDLFAARAPRASAANLDAQARQITRPWARMLLSYDPAPALKRLRMPVLALNGAKDVQVPPDQSLPAIRKALTANPDATVAQLPDVNHMFQTADTGAITEYAAISESMAPAVLDRVSDWIVQRVGRP